MIVGFHLVSCSKLEPVGINPGSFESSSVLHSGARKVIGSSSITYEIDPVILGYFNHFCQSNSANADIKSNGCGPVSYVMGAACLAAYKGYTLSNFTGSNPWDTKAQHIKKNVSGGVPMVINYLPNYITKFDKYTSSSSSVNLINHVTAFAIANTNDTKAFIEAQLEANHFVIVPLQAHVYSRSIVDDAKLYVNDSSNPDYSISEQTGSYISDKSNNTNTNTDLKVGGHYVIIIGLKKSTVASGTSIITYVDPLANTRSNGASNRKHCNYDRFIASMHKNSINNPGKSNAIAIY